jgi:hypothetical protein
MQQYFGQVVRYTYTFCIAPVQPGHMEIPQGPETVRNTLSPV